MSIISTNVKRKKVDFDYRVNEDTMNLLLLNPHIHMLHCFKYLTVSSKEKYFVLVEMIKKVFCFNMIDAKLVFNLSAERDTNMRLLEYDKYAKKTDLTFLNLYRDSIDKLISLKVSLSTWVYSAIFIEEIHHLKDIAFISHIIFPWTKDKETDSLISIWKKSYSKSYLKFNRLILAWTDMQIYEVSKLIEILPSDYIFLITNRWINDVIELVKLCKHKETFKIHIIIHNRNPYLVWEDTFSYENKYMCLRDWLVQWSNLKIKEPIILRNIKIERSDKEFVQNLDQYSINHSKILRIKFDIEKLSQSTCRSLNKVIYVNNDDISFNKELISLQENYLCINDSDSNQNRVELNTITYEKPIICKYSANMNIKDIALNLKSI